MQRAQAAREGRGRKSKVTESTPGFTSAIFENRFAIGQSGMPFTLSFSDDQFQENQALVSDIVRKERRRAPNFYSQQKDVQSQDSFFGVAISDLARKLKDQQNKKRQLDSALFTTATTSKVNFDKQLDRKFQFPLVSPLHENRFLYDSNQDLNKVRVVKGSPNTFAKIATGRLPELITVSLAQSPNGPCSRHKKQYREISPRSTPKKQTHVVEYSKCQDRFKYRVPTPVDDDQAAADFFEMNEGKEDQKRKFEQLDLSLVRMNLSKVTDFGSPSPRGTTFDKRDPYSVLPSFMSMNCSRQMNHQSIKETSMHKSQLLDQHSTLKRHTVSQFSKMHHKLKKRKQKEYSYEQADIALDQLRSKKKIKGLTDVLVDAGFMKREDPIRNYSKDWVYKQAPLVSDSDSDVASYHGK